MRLIRYLSGEFSKAAGVFFLLLYLGPLNKSSTKTEPFRGSQVPGTAPATKESFVKYLEAKINIPCQERRVCSTGACSLCLPSCCPPLSFDWSCF